MNPGNLIPRWFNVIVAITGMLTASSYRWEVAHDARHWTPFSYPIHGYKYFHTRANR